MKTDAPTWAGLLARLPSADERAALERLLAVEEARARTPWFLNLLAGFGAWIAALVIMPFFGLLNVFDNFVACVVLGMLITAAAFGLSRATRQVFPSQLALAALLTGNVLILVAVALLDVGSSPPIGLMVLSQAALAVLAGFLFTGAVGRFLLLAAVPVLAVGWVWEQKIPEVLHLIIGLLAAATGWLYTWKSRPPAWDVVGWAVLFSLPGCILLIELLHGQVLQSGLRTPLWPSSLVLAGSLIWLVWSEGEDCRGRWSVAIPAAILLMASFTSPGILVALLLIFLGRSHDEPVLTITGHLFLAGFLLLFYYSLNTSLALKSGIATGSGVTLLLAALTISRFRGREGQP